MAKKTKTEKKKDTMCGNYDEGVCKISGKPIDITVSKYCQTGRREHWSMPHCYTVTEK